ncbi:FHA domain-containing protein [Halobacteriovorax sp.]|uniref:FHA domain-containing protein n=1 Tax=Halobacteriovorax sp. TaxID=2020862 RepID=UPI0035658817
MSDKTVPFFFDFSREVVIELSHGMTFGRNKDCDYTVVDHRVSGAHFKVILKDNEAYIVDLESSNKTKLNGNEVNPNTETKLSLKDKIRFGEQQFYYFNESIEDFVIPDITRTLTISNTADVVDEMIDLSNDYRGINLSISTNKKKSMLGDLKKSKALVGEHEQSLKNVLGEIEKRNSVSREYDSLMLKIKNSKEELSNANFVDKGTLSAECEKSNLSIRSLTESINNAQKQINAWKKEIELLQEKIEEAKRVEQIHKCLESDQLIERNLSKEVERFREMNLDNKKAELQKLIKSEFENYKTLQEEYSDSLKYKKNRLAS